MLGGLITYLSAKAYRRSRARPLLVLAVGFGIVTLGNLIAGAADQVLNVAPNTALVIESALTAVGFAVIVYSLYAD